MDEVYRLKDAADLLGLSPRTILKYLEEKPQDGGPRKHFCRAYIPYNQRSRGWHIPEQDVLDYARSQGEWLEKVVEVKLRARHELAGRTG